MTASRTVAIAAVVAVSLAVLASCSSARQSTPDGGQQREAGAGSCAAPFLRSDPTPTPPEPGRPTSYGRVERGATLVVFGHRYFGGPCDDVGTVPPKSRPHAASVTLTLATSNGKTVVLDRVVLRSDSFRQTVTVPTSVAPGPARITDGNQHSVVLTVV